MFLRRRVHILITSLVLASMLFAPLSVLVRPAAAKPWPTAATLTTVDDNGDGLTDTATPIVVRFYASAGDGRVSYTGSSFSGCSQTTWNTGHNATSGTASYTTAANANWVGTGCTSGSTVNLSRGFVVFDTSALPDDAVITSASVNVYVTGKSDSKNDGNGFVSIVQGLQTATASLTATDYARAGSAITNPLEGSNRLDISSIGTTAYARWDLTATGVGWVSKTGVTKLAVREGHDIVNAWPGYTSNSGDYISVYLSEQTGTAQDPYIEVAYLPAAPVGNNTSTPTPTNTPAGGTPTPTNTPLPTNTPTSTPVSAPTTVRFYASAGDGRVSYTGSSFSGCSQTTWNTGHNATSGTASYTTAANANWVGTGCTSGSTVNLSRGFLVFDTSALPDDAVITSASVNVYVTGKSDSKNDGNGFVSIVQGLQTSTASLTATDYARAGSAITNPLEGSNRLDISSIGTTAYARWDLTATGVGWVSKTGVTKLALREGHDIVNAWPGYTSNSGDYISVYLSEQTGTVQDPYIEITYTRAGALMVTDLDQEQPLDVIQPLAPDSLTSPTEMMVPPDEPQPALEEALPAPNQ